jgi:hypothetical protein
MKSFQLWLFPLFFMLVVLFAVINFNNDEIEAVAQAATTPSSITCVVESTAAVASTQRIGMNMSFRTTYGAEQYMRNVLMNPGFEGQIDRILVIVSQTDQVSFSDGKGLGEPDGLWNQATFEVRSGQSVGVKGTIVNSLITGANGLPQYFTEGPPPPLAVNDVIAITLLSTPNPVNLWWFSQPSIVTVDTANPRPGSTGTCSAALTTTAENPGGELDYYLDTLNGNLLRVTGPWNLSFWVQGDGSGVELVVNFARLNGSAPFFTKSVPTTNVWQQVSFNFNATDTGPPAGIKLGFGNYTPHTTIWLDDVELGPVQASNPLTAWRQDVIDMLKTLKPSYLRNWQLQLSSTFQNETADQFKRQCNMFRYYGGAGSPQYNYSIPEFLDLCTQVGANPWIIIPSTFGDAELDAFGLFLSQNTEKFSDVAIEFGNENWNSLFRSEGINNPVSHGAVSDRAFSRITAAAGPNIKFTKVINAQYGSPGFTEAYINASQESNLVGVAPYFFTTMETGSSNATNLTALFADDSAFLKQIQQELPSSKTLGFYEINLGTSEGTATTQERVPFVVGAAGGAALAKSIIQKMAYKVAPISVFCFAQYNQNLWNVKGTVNLQGVCVDCSPTKRWRPTGLAIIMLNEVIGGSYHNITPKASGSTALPPEAANLTMAAFQNAKQWNAAIVSANPNPVDLVLEFPNDSLALPTSMNVLKYTDSYLDTNEETENVKITTLPLKVIKRTVSFTVPAYGFVVLLTPAEAAKLSSFEDVEKED